MATRPPTRSPRVAATGLIRQNVAGLVAERPVHVLRLGSRFASGTMTVSHRHPRQRLDRRGWSGPTAVTLTTTWQRFKVTGTLTGGADGALDGHRPLHAMAGPPASRSMRGARASSRATIRRRRTPARGGTRPRRSRREWPAVAVVVSAVNNTDSPFKVRGPGSNLADHTLLEVTAGGELIIAGGTGNGYRLAEIDGRDATRPDGPACSR